MLKKFIIQTYNVGFVKKNIADIMMSGFSTHDVNWLKHPYKDRFFADPFLIKSDDKYYYLFVEEYLFWTEKGTIVLLKVRKSDYTLVERKLILEEAYHLSFPYCKYNGDYFIPESINGDATYKYYFDKDFTIIKKEKIYDEGLVDAIFFEDLILASKKVNPKSDLYILNINESGQTNKEPIYSDIRYTRSAGDMFFFQGNLIRPVQDSEGRYGKQMRLLKINQLRDKYEFEDICTLNSFDNPPYNETCHTFNYYDDICIIDGSKDICRFPAKAFYKLRKYFNNRRKKYE